MSAPVEDAQGPPLPGFVRHPFGVVRRRWPWMLAATVAGIVATIALVSQLVPSYRARVSLLVSSQQIPRDFVRTTVPEDILQRVDAFMAQALTRERLVDLIEEHDLYPELRETRTLADIASLMRSQVEVALDPSFESGRRQDRALVFQVAYSSPRPETAAAVANSVAGLIQSEAIRTRTQLAELTTSFLRREMEEAESRLRELEGEITAFKQRYRGELPEELQSNLSRLERLQQQRQSLELQIAQAANRLTMLSSSGGGEVLTPDARLLALRRELASELTTKTEAHPDVIGLRRQIAALEQTLADMPASPSASDPAASGLLASERRAVDHLRARLAETEAAIANLDSRVARTPERQAELDAMEQDAGVLRSKYLEFLDKVQQAELAESLEQAQQGERVTVLSWADPPARPEQDRRLFLAAGVLASLVLGAAVGVLLELLDPVMVDATQVEATLDLPILGSAARIR